VRLDVAFKVWNAVAAGVPIPRLRKRFKKGELKPGLLLESQQRAGIQMPERLLDAVVLKHVFAGFLVAGDHHRRFKRESTCASSFSGWSRIDENAARGGGL
jgi:hypothetical protein